MPTWEVELFVYGPITIKDRIRLNEPKGLHLENPFYSDIDLRRASYGVLANFTARASTNQLANKAALFFGGRMLDVLAIHINLPLYISLFERRISERRLLQTEGPPVRRVIEQKEWHSAFEQSHLLAQIEPTFLRALGWYRKGSYTEDPFDKFLAFWISIEIVVSKYHPQIERARNESKSQMWESFKDLWGDCSHWPIITDDEGWIDRNYKIRKDIAHGVASVDVKQVETVVEKLETIEKVAYAFLTGWKEHKLNLQCSSLPATQPGYSTHAI